MIYERHKRGKIFGGEAEVCPDTFLCRDSFVSGRADIWQSQLIKSRVQFDSKVRMSQLELSSVGLETSKCEITASILSNTIFEGGTALKCKFYGSAVKGQPYMRGSGVGIVIVNSHILDEVRIEGDAVINGITLDRKMRVGTGVWARQPRYLEIHNEIAEVGITESIDGFAYILCNHRPMYKWIKKRALFQKKVGWTDEMIQQIYFTFQEWLDCPMSSEVANG